MKKSQLKSVAIIGLVFLFLISIIYAISSTLITPDDNTIDSDGMLDLRVSCTPTAFQSSNGTSWNITNVTLFHNIGGGTFSANKTISNSSSGANVTTFFNFTNVVNASTEGEFKWNVLCTETKFNESVFQNATAGNNTIKVNYADPDVATVSPANALYSFDGKNISIVCEATPSAGWNLTYINLIIGKNATEYRINSSYNQTFNQIEEKGIANFSYAAGVNNSIADGTDLTFSCSAVQEINQSGIGSTTSSVMVTHEFSSGNRTINVEYPPVVRLVNPDDSNWSTNLAVNLTWNVTNAFGIVPPYDARIWTNETGNWLPASGVVQSNNDSRTSKDYTFPEKSSIIWGVQAFDKNDGNVFNFSVNRTIRLDSTAPTVVVNTRNNSIHGNISPTQSVRLNITVSDANLNTVFIRTNFNNSDMPYNYTNTSAPNGVAFIVTFDNVRNGRYNFSVIVNESSGRSVDSGNYSIDVDFTKPGISNIGNFSIANLCQQRLFNWTTNETTNFTMYIDTDTDVADGTIIRNSTKNTSHSVQFDYGANSEISHYFNITSCDTAGNCNTSTQFKFETPASICSGWSQYAVYDGLINLSTIQNQSGADLVYFWNATAQDWVFFTAGLTTNAGVNVGKATYHHVVHLFENTNSTWYRNTTKLLVDGTSNGDYRYNLSIVNNWVSVPRVFNFGNFTETFMNASVQFPSGLSNVSGGSSALNGSTGGGPGVNATLFNFTFFAGYNNSRQDYVNHLFNFTWANATLLEPCPLRNIRSTCMEAVWVASGFNVSWNTSQIYINWTR